MLNEVREIAKHAGSLILSIYNSSEQCLSDSKSDGSPLTNADRAAHDYIFSALNNLYPNIPIVSEEGATAAWEERKNWSRFFLVDPLDGTKEFLKRNGEFTVNIALVEKNQPVLGVVHVPVLATTYSAALGAGAWRSSDEQELSRIQIRKRAEGEALIVVGSRSHGSTQLDTFLAKLPKSILIARGSSLKLCMIAEGQADLYPRHGPTSLWDIAAGHCLISEAGGFVVDPMGNPLCYGDRESLINKSFLSGAELDISFVDCFSESLS
jgi:3'(2'), 5'-bisphosphate nucleotidase